MSNVDVWDVQSTLCMNREIIHEWYLMLAQNPVYIGYVQYYKTSDQYGFQFNWRDTPANMHRISSHVPIQDFTPNIGHSVRRSSPCDLRGCLGTLCRFSCKIACLRGKLPFGLRRVITLTAWGKLPRGKGELLPARFIMLLARLWILSITPTAQCPGRYYTYGGGKTTRNTKYPCLMGISKPIT